MQTIYTSPLFIGGLIITLIIFIYLTRKEIYQMFFGYGVPFVPTTDIKIPFIIKYIKLKKGQKCIDLGCGDGKVLAALEKKANEDFGPDHSITFVGIENSPLPYKLALKNKKEGGFSFEVKKADFFKEDFSQYDVVYSYLLPYLMIKVWKKIQKECRPGTLFYSNSFKIPGIKEIQKIETVKNNYIYIYEV